MKKYRVLICEGGGIFGCIISHFLSMLPSDKQNLEKVDVIGGCSVGALLACSYAIGRPFVYVDDVFQKRAKECFTKRFNARINILASPTYRADTIDSVIHNMIGDETVGDIKKHYPNLKFVVPALNVTKDEPIAFENMSGKWDAIKLEKVAQCSSAAPSYFEGRELGGDCIIDGGVLDVVGVLTTVIELKRNLNIPFEDLNVLVLGTGKDIDPNPLTLKRYNGLNLLGVATDVLAPYVTLSNKLWSKQICSALGFNYFEYFNPIETNGKLDDVSQIPSLVKEADKHREEFLRVWNYWISL